MTTRPMTTRPKKTEQNVIADARHVADAARRYFAVIQEMDARREEKLLTEERLARFEANIEDFVAASGGSITGLALQAGATLSESARREVLYEVLGKVRAEVKVAYKRNRAIGRAFGVGLVLEQGSTPSLLKVGNVVLASWREPELRLAAERAGIDADRMGVIADQVEALSAAGTAQGAMLAKGRGRTLTKRQLLREVRSETSYLREVAAVVFRRNPVVLTEFASTQPRRAVTPRPEAGKPTGEGGSQATAPVAPPQGEQVAAREGTAQG